MQAARAELAMSLPLMFLDGARAKCILPARAPRGGNRRKTAVEPIATVSLHATLTCRSCLSVAMSPDAKRYWSDPFGL